MFAYSRRQISVKKKNNNLVQYVELCDLKGIKQSPLAKVKSMIAKAIENDNVWE